MSRATSAQYAQPCPVCKAGPFNPCRTLGSGRVTDTHLARLGAPKRAYLSRDGAIYVPTENPNLWQMEEPCREECQHPVHSATRYQPRQHFVSTGIIRMYGTLVEPRA